MNFKLMLSLFIVLVMNIGDVRNVSHGNDTIGDFKYQVFLLRSGPFVCSGVAIDERHILTAAHCVNMFRECPQMVTAERIISENFRDIYKVQKIHTHKKFRMGEYKDGDRYLENDIAIITVLPPVSYGENIPRIQLAIREPYEGETCIIAGWGREESDITNLNRRLLWAEASILSSDLCLLLDSEIDENEICTVDPNGKSTAFEGDSGGPLVCRGMLSGIISMSASHPKLPVTHTKVYSVSSSSFIKEVIQGHS